MTYCCVTVLKKKNKTIVGVQHRHKFFFFLLNSEISTDDRTWLPLGQVPIDASAEGAVEVVN